MSLTLYGFGPSRSFRCLWALYEADLEMNYIELKFGDTGSNGNQGPDYLQLNSQGKVPTLIHSLENQDDFILTESVAILNYVNALSGGQFIPMDHQNRAKYDELSSFIIAELEQPLWNKGKHTFALPEDARVPELLHTTLFEFEKAVTALGKLITINEFVLGDSFTFADILLSQTLNWAEKFEFDVPSTYLEYRDRMYQRDAVQKTLSTFS